jgi:hypothetical protein
MSKHYLRHRMKVQAALGLAVHWVASGLPRRLRLPAVTGGYSLGYSGWLFC